MGFVCCVESCIKRVSFVWCVIECGIGVWVMLWWGVIDVRCGFIANATSWRRRCWIENKMVRMRIFCMCVWCVEVKFLSRLLWR